MLSPETGINRAPPIEPLIAKELRDLASGRAFWVMLVFTSLLVGASFEQAVALYSEASRTAAQTRGHNADDLDAACAP